MDIFAIRRARLKLMVESVAKGNTAAFAERFGYSRAQISQFLSDTYNGGRSIGERAARALEAKFGAPTGWLDQPMNSIEALRIPTTVGEVWPGKRDIFAGREQGETKLITENIHVVGTIYAQDDGLVDVQGFPRVSEKKFLEHYSIYPHSYALQVKGNGLRPRAKSGEFLVIEPARKPVPGDDVFLKLASAEHMLLQLLYTKGDEYTFGQINENGPTAVVPEYDVVVMAVVGAILNAEHVVDFL